MGKVFAKQTRLHLAFAAGLTLIAILAGAARAQTLPAAAGAPCRCTDARS